MTVEVIWPPAGSMSLLTQLEADSISQTSQSAVYDLYRNCSLAVLNSGNKTDNSKELLDHYEDFEINVVRNERGLKIELLNPPKSAFVDGQIIQSLRNHLYDVLRDIVQLNSYKGMFKKVLGGDADMGEITSNGIFAILRNAGVLRAGAMPNLAVCWGGHSISEAEYEYAHAVGIALGLRKIDICTGCGPGIMEAPMKGSMLGHAQQCDTQNCRLIGLTEPSIIAAEPPNSMVSELVILPDIEKRLEAFVRLGHVMLIFPGGPGTAEELLYILSIKMLPENRHIHLPLVLTGNKDSKPYFDALEKFLKQCFGEDIVHYYRVMLDCPDAVAAYVKKELGTVYDHRTLLHDSYCFNWSLKIPEMLQKPMEVTHEYMAGLDLHKNQEPWQLAANLRSAFSGIVTGNVKENGVKLVAEKGPFKLHGDPEIIESMASLLEDFIKQGRILLSQREYTPCYVFEK